MTHRVGSTRCEKWSNNWKKKSLAIKRLADRKGHGLVVSHVRAWTNTNTQYPVDFWGSLTWLISNALFLAGLTEWTLRRIFESSCGTMRSVCLTNRWYSSTNTHTQKENSPHETTHHDAKAPHLTSYSHTVCCIPGIKGKRESVRFWEVWSCVGDSQAQSKYFIMLKRNLAEYNSKDVIGQKNETWPEGRLTKP